MKKKIQKNFYTQLTPITSFKDISSSSYYQEVPEDWYLIITDIIKSTAAIDDGRYKEVNIAGSLSVMALSNVLHSMDFPFLFGGDGMTYLVPQDLLEITKGILSDTRKTVKESYSLDLRIGYIQLKDLYDDGEHLSVAKYRVSGRYNQALIRGSAIDYAEKLIKSKECPEKYKVSEAYTSKYKADLSGFSCRWKDIPSIKEETISFIVKLREINNEDTLLHEILEKVYQLFGTEKDFHPLTQENLNLAETDKEVSYEAKAFSRKDHGFIFWLIKFSIRIQIFFFNIILNWKLPARMNKKEFNNARTDNIISSDFRKYDGTLKMVVSCDKKEQQEFRQFLEDLYKEEKIFYGIHIADKALMTCYIQFSTDSEVHFIDAANGGYAMAAKEMKAQMKDFL